LVEDDDYEKLHRPSKRHRRQCPSKKRAAATLFMLLCGGGGCVSVSPGMPVAENALHRLGRFTTTSGVKRLRAEYCAGKNQHATVTKTSTAGTDMMSSSEAQVWFTCN